MLIIDRLTEAFRHIPPEKYYDKPSLKEAAKVFNKNNPAVGVEQLQGAVQTAEVWIQRARQQAQQGNKVAHLRLHKFNGLRQLILWIITHR